MVAALFFWLALAAPAAAPSDAQIAGLLDRARDMHIVLMRLERADGPQARELIAQHWDQVQDYMGALQGVVTPPSPRADQPDCRVFGAWTPLGLPVEVDAYLYRAVMNALELRMRAELNAARDSASPAERTLRLQAHWNSAYQDLQALRGLGWMFGRWMPRERDGRVLPEPDSAGARHLAAYCTQCHALPPPSLHTAAEWRALSARMARHMERSDTPIPICVTPVPDADRPALLDYLQRHAR